MPEQFEFSRLATALQSAADIDAGRLLGTHPSLFSQAAIALPESMLAKMRVGIAAIEAVMATEAYRSTVLSYSPAIARQAVAPLGVFFGYDFHLAVDGPKLIEINTNAGGAMMNAMLLRAWGRDAEAAMLEGAIVAMFRQEWRLARGESPLRCIAIVDEAPAAQYLTPEFRLFQALFQRHGYACHIADPSAFEVRDGRLWLDGDEIDLIYNRLTDFALDSTVNAQIRAVYEAGNVVLTPHPRAHALHADKRNLSLLSDPDFLAGCGVDAETAAAVLACVPKTRLVHPDDGEHFWGERRRWFFKPAAGFGSRAAYRGDKLTRRVFEEILKGGYIAQETVPPSEHAVVVDGVEQMLKADFRCYVYGGETQLVAARLYQGQTTNFRTPGGGFAPVFAVDRGQGE